VAATATTTKKKIIVSGEANNNKNSNEPVLYKRERNKINSLARALQLEHALYQDETVMRFAALSDQIKDNQKAIENLRLDMQEAIHREFYSGHFIENALIALNICMGSSLLLVALKLCYTIFRKRGRE
jgi:hypothetical protein